MEKNKNNRAERGLLYGILITVAAAILIGGFFPEYAVHTKLLGDIFLNLLKMIVVPLVILSMIVGMVGLGDIQNLYDIGWKAGFYFLATTIIAGIIGLVFVNLIQPGKNFDTKEPNADVMASNSKQTSNQWESEEHPYLQYTLVGEDLRTVVTSDLPHQDYSSKYLLALMDQNVVGHIESISDISVTVKSWASLSKKATYVRSETGEPLLFVEDIATQIRLKQQGEGVAFKLPIDGAQPVIQQVGVLQTLKAMLLGNEERGGMIPQNLFNALVEANILPLIFFSLLIGYALLMQGQVAESVVDSILVVNVAIMQFVHWVMYFAPIGIFGLIAAKIGEVGGFANLLPELIAVGKYSATVLIGLLVHSVVVLPFLLWGIGGRNPLTFAKGMQPALLTAFSTASSSSTLPLTMDCVENNNGISSQTSIFILPLGATLNMNGVAIYFTVIGMFIAQVYGITMGPLEQCLVVLIATLMAISAASVPGASFMSSVILLRTLNLPVAGITHIIAIDWLMERFVTAVNIWGDAVCAGIIEKHQSEEAEEMLEEEMLKIVPDLQKTSLM